MLYANIKAVENHKNKVGHLYIATITTLLLFSTELSDCIEWSNRLNDDNGMTEKLVV